MNKRKWCIFGVINMVLFVVGAVLILSRHQDDITIYDIPLYDWQGEVDADNLFKAGYPASKYWFVAKLENLEPGIYTVEVNYTAVGESCYLYCSSDVDGNSYPAVYADDYVISPEQHALSFNVWVNSRLNYLNINIECGNTADMNADKSLYLDNITAVRKYRETVIYQTFLLTLLLILLDTALLIIWNRKAISMMLKKNFYVILGLACVFGIMSADCFGNDQMFGYDMPFHYARIMGIAQGLLSGEFPVRIQPGWINGYGYAVSVFYGDALLYIPAALYAIKVPIIYAYKFYMIFINMGTLLIAFFCFKKLSRDKYISVVCTALYCLSVNRILNVFLRAAVGEYSAYAFFPLVLLGMKEIFDEEENFDDSKYGWVYLCAGMTGIIQTHVLSFEMICIFIGITVLILIRRFFYRRVLFQFAGSVLLIICLNLNFLIPFLDYNKENVLVLSEKAQYGIQGLGLGLYELISVGISTGGQAMLSVKGLSRRFPESLGLPILLVILLCIIIPVQCSRWERKEKQRWQFIASLSAIAVFMSTYYFPWNRLSAISGIRNVVSSIQFPWRFISIAIPLLAYMACLLLMKLKTVISNEKMKYLMVGMCIICAISGLQNIDSLIRLRQSEDGQNYVVYDGDKLFLQKMVVSGAEYVLEGTDLDEAIADNAIDGEKVQVAYWERQGTQMAVSCRAEGKDAFIDFPLFQYDYYHCIDEDTKQEFSITRGENNKIRVALPEDYQGTLKVYFKEPWYWRLAEIISVAALIAYVCYILYLRRQFRLSGSVLSVYGK